MSIIQAAGAGESAVGFYPFEISNSLRFNRSNEDFLSLTPSNNNGGTWTYSTWIKRSRINDSSTLLDASVSGGVYDIIYFPSTNQLRYFNNGSQPGDRLTNALFRETSAWYNVIVAVDTTASAADTIKVYINGSEITSFQLTTNFDPSDATRINSNVEHRIGQSIQGGTANLSFDGYMADINFVDGSALGPSSFGELKENIWIPKDTSGLYASAGANSFRLQFKNSSTGSASSSTVGADTSGKNNHFSSSTNITSTSVTNDSPTNNHATFNPEIIMMNNASSYRGIGSFSDGALLLTTDADNESGTVPFGATSGKYYMEFTSVTLGNRQQIMVFSRDDFRGDSGAVTSSSDASGNATGRESWTSGDVIGIAVDLDNSKVFFAKNNNYFGTSNPATNTGGDSLTKLTGVGVRHDSGGTNTTTIRFNAGQIAFTHSPPAGFKSLSTANLPAPAIDPAEGENPTEYWDAQLYTGDSGTQEISKFAFQPDWVWIKNRDNADDHYMYDSIRGATKTLHPNDTPKEFTSANALQSFDSDGFTTGGDGGTNRNTQDYVAWAWRAGGVPTADNSAGAGNTPTAGSVKIDGANLGSALAGTLAATRLSANTESGFSIVTFTLQASGSKTVAHGLSSAPEMIIFKSRSNATGWIIQHAGVADSDPFTDFINFNSVSNTTAGGVVDNATVSDDTAPTNSVFTIGSGFTTGNYGANQIAYCFHSVDGFSKFAHYFGNGTTPGTFVFTGFRPAWVMIKSVVAGERWNIFDNGRSQFNTAQEILFPDKSVVESTGTTNGPQLFSNGFQVNGNVGNWNHSGVRYFYMAFADQPFKYSNAK